MSVEIDPREVLEHLEYLGYTSITKEQLKDFIRDLKKLIKYEQCKEKRGQTEKQEIQDKISVACETSFPLDSQGNFLKHEISPSRLANDEHFSIHVNPCSASRPVSPNLQKSYHVEDYDYPNVPQGHNCHTCCKHCDEKNDKPCERRDCCRAEKHPCPSFIRPGLGKPAKCDPVALYHYYQNQWSKRPLPGEDPRSDLRWAVRTKLAQQKQQQQVLLRKNFEGVHRKKVQT